MSVQLSQPPNELLLTHSAMIVESYEVVTMARNAATSLSAPLQLGNFEPSTPPTRLKATSSFTTIYHQDQVWSRRIYAML